jgi:hypothetical protein
MAQLLAPASDRETGNPYSCFLLFLFALFARNLPVNRGRCSIPGGEAEKPQLVIFPLSSFTSRRTFSHIVHGRRPPGGTDPLFAVSAGGFFGNAPASGGYLDFALLNINPARAATSTPLDNGPLLRQVMPAAFVVNNQIPMTKFGAATGRTAAAFSAPVSAIFIGGFTVTNVLEFKGIPGPSVAAPGDSGALAVSAAAGSVGTIIGILFAATPHSRFPYRPRLRHALRASHRAAAYLTGPGAAGACNSEVA